MTYSWIPAQRRRVAAERSRPAAPRNPFNDGTHARFLLIPQNPPHRQSPCTKRSRRRSHAQSGYARSVDRIVSVVENAQRRGFTVPPSSPTTPQPALSAIAGISPPSPPVDVGIGSAIASGQTAARLQSHAPPDAPSNSGTLQGSLQRLTMSSTLNGSTEALPSPRHLRIEQRLLVMTGPPTAWASMIGNPNPSYVDGKRSRFSVLITEGRAVIRYLAIWQEPHAVSLKAPLRNRLGCRQDGLRSLAPLAQRLYAPSSCGRRATHSTRRNLGPDPSAQAGTKPRRHGTVITRSFAELQRVSCSSSQREYSEIVVTTATRQGACTRRT